jgi:adenylate cyclase
MSASRRRWLRHELPLTRWRFVVGALAAGLVVGGVIDHLVPTALDRAFHDAAVAARPRLRWEHTAVVALDPAVPPDVTRIQLLPLYARAAHAALDAGARAVYLDASVLAFPDRRLPYPECFDPSQPKSPVRWLRPSCLEGEIEPVVDAPLALTPAAAERFLLPPPLGGEGPADAGVCRVGGPEVRYPLEMLVGMRAARKVTVACADLPRPRDERADGVQRWVAHLPRQVAVLLAARVAPERARAPRAGRERCTVPGGAGPVDCFRVRFGRPSGELGAGARPVLALSALADCDPARARAAAAALAGRVVILQMTGLEERADLHVTPMTVGAFGPRRFTPGAQVLADAVETLVAGDHPRRAPLPWRLALLALAAIVGALGGAYLRAAAAVLLPVVVGAAAAGAAFVTPTLFLWPVVAATAAALVAVGATLGVHLLLGTRRGRLTARYLPLPVRSLLLAEGAGSFRQRGVFAAVLFSDVRGYSTVTGILKSPEAVLNMLNDYLTTTTVSMQERHGAWLESYVGDMVLFYWPAVGGETPRSCMERALQAGVALSRLQREYFAALPDRPIAGASRERLEQVAAISGAGVGLAAGDVVMGNLGPEQGIQRFGLLGDVLNLGSRLESLSRLFNAEVVATAELAEAARGLGLRTRRLGRLKVKGRIEPAEVHAVGAADDPRFAAEPVTAWEAWAASVAAGTPAGDAPALFERDAATLTGWVRKGLLDAATGTFVLDEK